MIDEIGRKMADSLKAIWEQIREIKRRVGENEKDITALEEQRKADIQRLDGVERWLRRGVSALIGILVTVIIQLLVILLELAGVLQIQ